MSHGVDVAEVADTQNLISVLELLGKRGIIQVMVEGGAKLHSSFLQQQLVNRLVVYTGPALIGGSGQSWLSNTLATTMNQVKFLKLVNVKQLANDVRSEYDLSTSEDSV